MSECVHGLVLRGAITDAFHSYHIRLMCFINSSIRHMAGTDHHGVEHTRAVLLSRCRILYHCSSASENQCCIIVDSPYKFRVNFELTSSHAHTLTCSQAQQFATSQVHMFTRSYVHTLTCLRNHMGPNPLIHAILCGTVTWDVPQKHVRIVADDKW